MAGFQSPITINEAVQKIRGNEYLLPAFQREYVWKPKQVEELFDSLMRGYPISSMLFWRVKDESKIAWKFYGFLNSYRERYGTHNNYFETRGHKDFDAILDGQQRLTSIYLALFGHYDIHKNRYKWEDDDRYFKICYLYFNLTQTQDPKNPNVEYEFLWLDRKETEGKMIYEDEEKQKWFKCGDLYKYETSRVVKISREYGLSDSESDRLDLFHQKIFDKQLINFYLEEEQDPDKAVNIFIRINSGGQALDYSDILFSIAIANWKGIDARTEINDLVDTINHDFSISKDLILKGFLFLFHNNIKYQINSFDKGFIEDIEKQWENIKFTFIEIFRLLRSFGLSREVLSTNNIVLPILYFVYHHHLTHNILNSVDQKENRELIKAWILRVIVFKPFGGSGDDVLANMRRAFVKDFRQDSQKYFDDQDAIFPLEKIEKEARYRQDINEDFLDSIIQARKNSPEAFVALALLYPHLDYKNNNFHKDHLHPESAYKEYEKIGKRKQEEDPSYEYSEFPIYDSLLNLQMLDANENMAKQDKALQEWVNENCGNDKRGFLERHLIPDIDLSLENFDEFIEHRKRILKDRLKDILSFQK